jgi:hypothetical protein
VKEGIENSELRTEKEKRNCPRHFVLATWVRIAEKKNLSMVNGELGRGKGERRRQKSEGRSENRWGMQNTDCRPQNAEWEVTEVAGQAFCGLGAA